MLTGFAEKAIFTKLKTMYGQSLTATDYQSLTLRRSVGEIAAYLKNETHFSQVLSNVKESMVRRGYLEDLLRRVCFSGSPACPDTIFPRRIRAFSPVLHGL